MVDILAGVFLIRPISPPFIGDQFVHHKQKPNTITEIVEPDFHYLLKINDLGLRGENIQIKKSQGSYRILMLGDSFTMGHGVKEDETFSVILEQNLNSHYTMGKRKQFEVINGGVDSYTPLLSYLLLTKILPPLNPDMVILNFDMSDLVQEAAYRNSAFYGENGEVLGVDGRKEWEEKKQENLIELKKMASSESIRRLINKHLYISRFVIYKISRKFDEYYKNPNEKSSIEKVVTLADPELLKHTLANDNTDRDEQWENIFDSILKIKNYCDDHGIQFILTTYPWGHQSVDILIEFSKKNKINALNLFPIYRSHHVRNPLYYNYDMHWTPAGHQLMASALIEYIGEKFLDKESGSGVRVNSLVD